MELLRRLHKAVKAGDEAGVQAAVAAGADVDHLWGMEGTALCQAICTGQQDMVQALLELGCDVNARDFDGGSPFSLAINKHKTDIALQLLKVPQIDLNLRDPVNRRPPLCSAVVEGLVDVVEALVQDTRCKYLECDREGNSALHLAVINKQTHITQILARCSGFRHLHNNGGMAPVHIIAQCGDCQNFDILYPSVARKEEVYHHTIGKEEDDLLTAVALTEIQREINQRSIFSGDTPLHLAIREGHLEIVDRLLLLGAAVDIQNNSGQTALLMACAKGNVPLALHLLLAGSPLNVPGILRMQQRTLLATHTRDSTLTPLHVAASSNNTKLAEILCEFGADVNVCDERGRSPLYLALINGASNVAMFLIQNAGQKIKIDVVMSLHGNTLLHAMSQCQTDATEVTKALIKLGCSINQANNMGNLPLHEAISWENVAMLRALLSSGANPAVRGGDGSLPLRLAAMTGNVEIGSLLLKAGADINGREGSQDFTGRTLEDELSPLQEALHSGMVKFARFLVENGCSLSTESYLFGHMAWRDKDKTLSPDNSSIDSIDGNEDDYDDNDNEIPEIVKYDAELLFYLQQHACNPKTLLQSCLDTVRCIFQREDPPFALMVSLPLPEKIIERLFYQS